MIAQMKLWSILTCIGLTMTACGPTQHSLKQRKTEVSTLKRQLKSIKKSRGQTKTYESALKGKKHRWIAISKAGILKAMQDYLPYKYKGKTLSKKRLRGTFSFDKPSALKLHPGNKLSFTMAFGARGVSVNLKGVFGAGKSDAREIKKALEGGGNLKMEVGVRVVRSKGEIQIFPKCVGVQLRVHNSSRNRGYLKDAVNGRLFRHGLRIPLPDAIASQQPYLFSTPNNFVLVGSKK
jgi:hypothetical protein